jgi:hypothetical protein
LTRSGAPAYTRRVSPTRWLEGLLARDELRALARSLLGAAYERASAGLPRLSPSADTLRVPHVILEMSRPPDAASVAVLMTASHALGLVDRVLGGHGHVSLPPLVPSAAECGVLAYPVARALALLAPDLRLADVRVASRDELAARTRGHVTWPLWLTGEAGELGLGLVLSREAARALAPSFTIQLVLSDAAGSQPLEQGAVLVSDRWMLSATTEGWTGAVEVLVADVEHGLLSGRLERGTVTCAPENRKLAPLQLTLVLAERRVDIEELAAIADGERPAFADLELGEARLLCGAEQLAAGRLATYQGGLAFVVTRCGSAASPAHPHG